VEGAAGRSCETRPPKNRPRAGIDFIKFHKTYISHWRRGLVVSSIFSVLSVNFIKSTPVFR
jgi:hypothetical protein